MSSGNYLTEVRTGKDILNKILFKIQEELSETTMRFLHKPFNFYASAPSYSVKLLVLIPKNYF
jgi:hypothetical protein